MMKKHLIILSIALFSCFGLLAQTRLDSVSNNAIYVSKKKTYEIHYNLNQWRVSSDSTIWDIEFHDIHNLVTAYFSAFSYYIPKNKLKETIKSQFKQIGKIKALRIYKKKLKHMEVDYFEYELIFNGYIYKYQGFVYSGRSGSVELQVSGQEESINNTQKLIDELCNGILEIK